jgi:putative ABC transport system permease protein
MFEAVLGADVAKALGYQVNDKIVISHGIGNTSFTHHEQAPFVVSGIVESTGTPVDKTVHVGLEAIEAIHLSPSVLNKVVNNPNAISLTPQSITSVLLGLTSKFATFTIQRDLNNYPNDRLMAVLPGVAMAELWSVMSTVENLLRAIAALVLLSSLFGLVTMLLASMNERQGEIAVLRVLGAGPVTLLLLILFEALIIVCLALATAIGGLTLMLMGLNGWLASEFGLFLNHNILSLDIINLSGLVILATLIVSLFPGLEAYKNALHVQLTAK